MNSHIHGGVIPAGRQPAGQGEGEGSAQGHVHTQLRGAMDRTLKLPLPSQAYLPAELLPP